MKEVYLLLIGIGIINLILFIRLYKRDRDLAKERFQRLMIYLVLVFSIYKLIGDHYLIPFVPAIVLIPFFYFDFNKKRRISQSKNIPDKWHNNMNRQRNSAYW